MDVEKLNDDDIAAYKMGAQTAIKDIVVDKTGEGLFKYTDEQLRDLEIMRKCMGKVKGVFSE